MNVISGVAVRAVAAAVPTKVELTQDYEHLTPNDRLRFEKATGIRAHRVSPPDQCASDLCAAAALRGLEHAGWDKSEVGILVLITQTPDQPIPATSIVLQHKLGLPDTCVTFDVNLGCSAYPYGLAIVGSMMKSLGIAKGLLLMGDVSSRVCARHDKSSWPLFGDAGSATALELADDAPPMYFDMHADGSGKDAIIVPGGGLASRIPPGSQLSAESAGADGIVRTADNLVLKGADIFSFAISKAPPSVGAVLAAGGHDPGNVDFLVLHQANKMINDTIAKKTGFDAAKAISTLGEFGNTSSASIPLTLCAHAERFDVERLVVACGFGVGLSWGSALLSLPAGSIASIVESDDVY